MRAEREKEKESLHLFDTPNKQQDRKLPFSLLLLMRCLKCQSQGIFSLVPGSDTR